MNDFVLRYPIDPKGSSDAFKEETNAELGRVYTYETDVYELEFTFFHLYVSNI